MVYTKWYRVWERTQPSDFYLEAILIPFILLALLVHFMGTSKNRRKASKWMAVHYPVLDSEFALVGYHRGAKAESSCVSLGRFAIGERKQDDWVRGRAS